MTYKYLVLICIMLILLVIFLICYLNTPWQENLSLKQKDKISFPIRAPAPDNLASALKQMSTSMKLQRHVGKSYTDEELFSIRKLPSGLKKELKDYWTKFPLETEDVPDVIHGTEMSDTSQPLVSLKPLEKNDRQLYKKLNDYIRHVLIDWSGQLHLTHRATYGPREYHRGAVLQPHVDRGNTHVLSAIINIQQNIDKPWPLVVYDRKGTRHEVLLDDDQDLVLYESAILIHGRPFPLYGKSYVNCFVHFEPKDWRSYLTMAKQKLIQK